MIVNYVCFQCDEPGCDAQSELHSDFKEAVQTIKALGWNSIKKGEKDWQHFCPEHA